MGYVSKSEFIRLRVADWEKHYISTKAAKAKMSLSEYVRSAAMDKHITVLEFSDELMTELRRQGNNLNQLTVMAHQGRIEQINYEPFAASGHPLRHGELRYAAAVHLPHGTDGLWRQVGRRSQIHNLHNAGQHPLPRQQALRQHTAARKHGAVF